MWMCAVSCTLICIHGSRCESQGGGGERGAITFLLPDLNVIFSLENRGISLARISSSSSFSLLLE